MTPATATLVIWGVAAAATLGVVLRPFRWNEAVWAVAGAALLLLLGALPAAEAWRGVRRGTDVYLFLVGMMLLSEVARQEGLFDWIAGRVVRAAGGSARRLFALVYGVGILVTAFLSNDATAVVLTPAVYAAARAARAEPLPYLFACAFVANAASFLLPVSNPANLVVYAGHMPPLAGWLRLFGPASLGAIAATYAVLLWTQRRALAAPIAAEVETAPLPRGARVAALGIAATTAGLMAASVLGAELGPPTLAAGLATAALVRVAGGRGTVRGLAAGVSWSVLPLVAGLFVLVQALENTGLVVTLAELLRQAAAADQAGAVWGGGILVALATNLANNLPVGLLAGATVQAAGVPAPVAGAVLVGINLGPNLSVTGSLATILWLLAIRREGEDVSAWRFLRLGALVMPPALLLALAGLAWAG